MSIRKLVTMPDTLLARITDWRRVQDDLPTESEAIRRLILAGLQVHEAAESKVSTQNSR